MTAAIEPDGGGDPALERARRVVARSRRALVLTGAGISADSGMPTFRGEDGLWKERRPEELASPSAFRRDPRLVWEWYVWRREKARGCDPSAGHLALARWTLRDAGVWLATQNVDGLHTEALERARGAEDGGSGGPDEPGCEGPAPLDAGSAGLGGGEGPEAPDPPGRPRAADRLLELHGSLFRVRCTGCGRRGPHREPVDATSRDALPRCPSCGALLRPDVVWFGESLDPDLLEAARAAAADADVCLSVGTSAAVEPAASVARAASRSGAELIEVNPEETALTSVASLALRGRAAQVLPRLLERG